MVVVLEARKRWRRTGGAEDRSEGERRRKRGGEGLDRDWKRRVPREFQNVKLLYTHV